MLLLDTILTLIAPHLCLSCRAEGSLICDWCRPDILSTIPSRCYRCRAITDNFQVCDKCRKVTGIKNVWVTTEYEELPMQLVKRLKFERAYAAGELIGALMADTLPVFRDAVITHVPTAAYRRRQRGYDQAEIIARAVARHTGAPYMALLARTGRSRQVGSTRTQRLKQLENSFRAIHTGRINGRSVVLVDDIVTTGATLQQAAKTLKSSGVKRVNAAVFAQKV